MLYGTLHSSVSFTEPTLRIAIFFFIAVCTVAPVITFLLPEVRDVYAPNQVCAGYSLGPTDHRPVRLRSEASHDDTQQIPGLTALTEEEKAHLDVEAQMGTARGWLVGIVAAAGVVALVAVGAGVAGARTGGARHAGPQAAASGPASATWAPPPANATFDYQIGEAYQPAAGVRVVSRDHDASPARGLYNICYVNGYQSQSEAAGWWKAKHSDLLLHHNGSLVVDGDWNEILLDVGTAAKRAALAQIVGAWIDECAAKGFQGLEIDNFDSYTRSQGLLSAGDALAYAALLTTHAHARGLAVAQKNTVELAARARTAVGFDFAIAEECANYDECDGYTSAYGNHVIVVEYDAAHFRKACQGYGASLSIVRRDRDVSAPGSSTYVYRSC